MESTKGGFDVAKVQQADGSVKDMTRTEYDAMPLSIRIQLVLRRQVEFFRDGVKITSQEALRI